MSWNRARSLPRLLLAGSELKQDRTSARQHKWKDLEDLGNEEGQEQHSLITDMTSLHNTIQHI